MFQMKKKLRERKNGLHPRAKLYSDGETESSSDSSERGTDPSSHGEHEDADEQGCDPNGLQFIVWTESSKTTPKISSLTKPQMDQLLDLDQQGVRFETIKSNVADGRKGNLTAATSKYVVKAYKFLTTIKPNITIKEAALHPVLRKRKQLYSGCVNLFLLVAKLRCSHRSCKNIPEYGCSKQIRCAAHNAAHIKDVIAKQVRLLKAQEPSSVERKPPRAPCLGVPKGVDNPNGDHSTTLLRMIVEVRKDIAKNAAQSKWADKHDIILTLSPPPEPGEVGGSSPSSTPDLIPYEPSAAQPLPPPSSSPLPSALVPSQDQSALSPTPSATSSTPMPASIATSSTPMPAPRPQAPRRPLRVQQPRHPQ
jgi:hypothetical protein